jgi:sigma-B regulation protein RsbU (phosphoserine phosphatase)
MLESNHREKILIINDDEDVTEITKMILTDKGYETYEALNGIDGIKQAVEKQPDLILLDILMPQMDGYEVCKRLKDDQRTKDIPVIFLSSLTSPQDKIKGLGLGAVDYINNVIDSGELLARVRIHLKITRLTHDLQKTNEELIHKQKSLDADLNAAKMIQKTFLPPTKFQMENIQSASVWVPANALGGDIFNIIPSGEDKIVFYMVDVSGHDVPSALVTISVSQFLLQNNLPPSGLTPPKKMLVALEKEYPLERFDRYFTVFYLVLDTKTGVLTYSGAGHPPAIVLRKNEPLKLLDLGGPLIGLNRSLDFKEGTAALEEGDKVILYTDGVSEMRNIDGHIFGMERLCELLENLKNEPIDSIINQVYHSIQDFGKGFETQDDISIFGFEFHRSHQ